jgi:hypothetical protein
MKFGIDHYVPVIKVKRGEKAALALIDSALRSKIVPLFEIIEKGFKIVKGEKKKKSIEEHLDTSFDGFAECALLYERCFIDSKELAREGVAVAEKLFERAFSDRIAFTPVTGIHRSVDLAPALKYNQNGLAIRVTRGEFENGNLDRDIIAFLRDNSLDPAAIDLIIDLGAVENMITDGIVALATQFLSSIPMIAEWHTLTVSGCAFPKSMSGIERNSYKLVERCGWLAWNEMRINSAASFKRIPTFSDCAIQHPSGVEGFDFRTMSGSATIRYALSKKWLLIKGVSTKKRLPSIQFPELARTLVSGSFRSYFEGHNHCEGCSSMVEASNGKAGFGSPEAWRRLATIHHITTTMQELARLP